MKYTGEHLKEIIFPLGGIGTGSIGIAGNGVLCDWEICNRPSKGSLNGNTHFAIKITDKSGKSYVRIISGDITKDLMGQYCNGRFYGYGFGPKSGTMCGFPHFRNVELEVKFPFAVFTFTDDDFPGEVRLTAWSPFIPHDADNSSIPGAFFKVEYINNTDSDMTADFCFSVCSVYKSSINTSEETDKFAMIHMKSTLDEADVNYGDMTVITDKDGTFLQDAWFRGDWQDAVVTYWNQLTKDGFTKRHYDSPMWGNDMATVVKTVSAPKSALASARFVLTWNMPNNYAYWRDVKDENGKTVTWKNYYAVLFENSVASAKYAMENYEMLYNKSERFANAMWDMTLPEYVTDAATATLSVLKSATVLRLEDGSFYGWEGTHESEGSCEGTCQHVWNYAYALCFLFPSLERSIRDLEFDYTMHDDGLMDFRIKLPLGKVENDRLACMDGQMGAVIKTYREWLISGDDAWLKRNFEKVKKALEFAWNPDNPFKWDTDKDGYATGRMHHTLDRELFGANGWLQGFYLAALKAASVMAEHLGETDKAKEYLDVFQSGYNKTKKELFNGSYFIQRVDLNDKSIPESFDVTGMYWNDETKEMKYQIGEGCEIDQLCGQWHANILGLGRLFDEEQTKTACESLYKNNFKESMRDFVNPWRIFALNDDAGSVICDYPEGAYKPRIPIPYCEECMHGFEYQLAGLLISEGYVDEGLRCAKAVRDKYNGANRNPFNEIECGNNYARSMASFALIPILSGFTFDMPHGKIGFNPKLEGNFKSVWSLDGVWGSYEKTADASKICINDGTLTIGTLALPYYNNVSEIVIDGKAVDFNVENGNVVFEKTEIKEYISVK